MNNPSKHDRVKSLYQMLFEMATGNFNFRIHKTGHDDQLDDLANLLNSVSEAMRQTVLDAGYVMPHYTYQSLVQTTFVLDSNFESPAFPRTFQSFSAVFNWCRT